MPRNQLNNPTERIRRLIADAQQLEAYAQALETALEQHATHLLASLPTRPAMVDLRLEIQRQELTHGRVLKSRGYMQRVRTASEQGNRALSFKDIASEVGSTITVARKAEIDAMIGAPAQVDPMEQDLAEGTLFPAKGKPEP